MEWSETCALPTSVGSCERRESVRRKVFRQEVRKVRELFAFYFRRNGSMVCGATWLVADLENVVVGRAARDCG